MQAPDGTFPTVGYIGDPKDQGTETAFEPIVVTDHNPVTLETRKIRGLKPTFYHRSCGRWCRYIGDPKDQGTETCLNGAGLSIPPSRYIGDPKDQGTETRLTCNMSVGACSVTLETRKIRALKLGFPAT